MEISKVFLRFLSLDFLFPRLNFTASCISFPPSLSFTHSHILSFVWHAITCIWHIYNNNNMLLVDNRHLGPPRSLIRTFFFFIMYTCYIHILIFIYLYIYIIRKSSVCVYVSVVSMCMYLPCMYFWVFKGPGPPPSFHSWSSPSFYHFRLFLAFCSIVYHKVSRMRRQTSELSRFLHPCCL